MKHQDYRGLRIGLSVLLLILAALCFIIFINFRTIKIVVQYDYVGELIKRVDIEKLIVEKLSEHIGTDVVDSDSSIAEAISEIVSDELGYEIDEEKLGEALKDEELVSDFVGYATEISGKVLNGDVDLDEFKAGFLDIFEKNKDVLGEVPELDDEAFGAIIDSIDVFGGDAYSGDSDNSYSGSSNDSSNESSNGSAYGSSSESVNNSVNDSANESAFGLDFLNIFVDDDSYAPVLVEWLNKGRALTGNLVIYGILASGILFCVIIIILNRYILSSGFRACGIVGIVTGVLNCLAGVILMVLAESSDILLGYFIENFQDYMGLYNAITEILAELLNRVSKNYLFVGGIILGCGIIFMIVSGIALSNERKRRNEQISEEENLS